MVKSLLPLIVVVFSVVAVLAVVAAVLKRREGGKGAAAGEGKLPYRKKDWLLTKAERAFYDVLVGVVEGQGVPGLPAARVFAKVRLEDLVWMPKGTDGRQAARNRVKSKHVDFVVCSVAELRPLVVVELDDSSHEREDRRERDRFVDRVMLDAGLGVVSDATFYRARRRSQPDRSRVLRCRQGREAGAN